MEREYDPVSGEEVPRRKRHKREYFDYSLLFVWLFIMLLGFVLLYSASSYQGLLNMNDSTYFLKRQLMAFGIGVVGVLVVNVLDYRIFWKFSKLIYILSLISVFLVWTPFGIERNGAKRWIGLGPIQFQPAELVKIGVIFITAYMLSKCRDNSLKNIKNCIRILLPSIIGVVLLYGITSNLSSAIIVAVIGFFMVIIAGADKRFIVGMFAFGGIGGTLMLLLSSLSGKGFRMARIMVWLHPEQYSDDGGYQVMQGLYAIGSGGLFGKGLGNSAQKMGFVPEATNDMIFSIICEELGIFGAVCIILLFAFMIRRMRVVASNAPDFYGAMLVIGVMIHISVQVILNIAVVTNSMPNTGVSLPYISYGGTSLAFLMVEMGLVLSISGRINKVKL